jgi:hypothetical protein
VVLAALTAGGSLGLTGAAASLAAAAITIGGSLLVGAMSPPPRLGAPQNESASALSSDPASRNPSAASLSGNVLAPAAPMPRAIGTMRVFPPLLCNPLIEVVGDDEYAEAVFGLVGPHELEDIRVGGTLIDSLTESTVEVVEGRPEDDVQSLVERQSHTNSSQTELRGHVLDETNQDRLADQVTPATSLPQPETFTSRKSPDEIWLNLAFPEGLLKGDDLSEVINVAVRIQMRIRGTDDFIKLPEIHFSMNAPSAFQKVIRLKWASFPAQPATPPTNQGPVYAFKATQAQSVSPSTTAWEADSYFSAGAGSNVLSAATAGSSNVLNVELQDDKVIFYLDEDVFPKGVYEIQITRSTPYESASFTPSNYQYGGTVLDHFAYRDSGGFSIIPVDHAQYRDRMVINRVSSIWNDNPVQTEGLSTISVRVHSRQLDNLSVLASGLVPVWDGSEWSGLEASQNPADHLYDVLTGSLGADPLPLEVVDTDSILEWRQHCIDNDLTVNAVAEGKRYTDVINMICSAGFGRIRNSEKWGVIIDRDRSSEEPVQIFTPRNMSNFSWTRAWGRRPTGLRATFANADDDFANDEIFVYDDPNNEDANRLEHIHYDGLVYEDDVAARARFDVDQSKARFTFYSGDADAESIICQRGDLVAVQHDILVKKAGFARIKEVLLDSGSPMQITGLVLDGTVPVFTTDDIYAVADVFAEENVFDLGQKTGVAIRLKDGGGDIIKEVTADDDGHTTEITFVTPFDDPGDIEEDCLVAAGPLGQEYKRLLIHAITAKNNIEATLTMVDEAPELFT